MFQYGVVFVFVAVLATVSGGYDSEIECYGLKCPLEAVRCTFLQQTSLDLSTIDSLAQCLDANNIVLDSLKLEQPNEKPGSHIYNTYSHGTGVHSQDSVRQLHNFGRDISARVSKDINGLQNLGHDISAQVNRNVDEMNTNMAKVFGDNFYRHHQAEIQL